MRAGRRTARADRIAGFTLIELAIVLLVIGLISGGILLGRDLIRVAEIRSQVSQLEGFTSAVSTFQVKYGGLPGDLTAGEAEALGFEPRAGTDGRGDGNGRLNGCVSCGGLYWSAYNFSGETSLFWNDLGRAGLVGGMYSGNTDDPFPIPPGGSFEAHMPGAKLGAGVHVNVWAEEGAWPRWLVYRVVFALARVIEIRPDGRYRTAAGLTPHEAHSIDVKMDDGLPFSGLAGGGRGMPQHISVIDFWPGHEPCLRRETDGTVVYELSPAYAGVRACVVNVAYRG